MVFEHLQILFNSEDLINKFSQLFFICFYVIARCIPKNIIEASSDAKLLVLAKLSSGIWPITVGEIIYQLVNKTLYF